MSDLMISQPLICWGPLWFKCLWASLFANFPTSYFSPKLSAFLKVKPSLSIELEPENRVCFLWFSSAALEEALIVYDLWIHLEWERTEEKGNKEVGKTTIERLRGFFFFRETIPRCKAPSCTPLPISSQTLWRITLRTVLHANWIFSFASGFSAQSAAFLSLHLSYPVLRLSGSLISYLAMSPGPLCVPSSLTLSFPVVPLICNSTSTSSLPLRPLSLTVIVSPALRQITSALRDRHMVHAQTGAGYQ